MFSNQNKQVSSKFKKAHMHSSQRLISNDLCKRESRESTLARKPAAGPSQQVPVRPQKVATTVRISDSALDNKPDCDTVAAKNQPLPNAQQEVLLVPGNAHSDPMSSDKVPEQATDAAKVSLCPASVISSLSRISTVKTVVKSRSTATVKAKSKSSNMQKPSFLSASGCNAYLVTPRRRSRHCQSDVFDYHLSHVEQANFGRCRDPMKSASVAELELLRSGQRATYLETRYERTPENKYNYPEATSWRYGWFHGLDDRANARKRQFGCNQIKI